MKPTLKKWTSTLDRRVRWVLDSQRNGRIALSEFRTAFPLISEQLLLDANSNVLSLWGNSVNFDEFEKCRIVDRKILSCFGRILGGKFGTGRNFHAGLLHTYGYLLSTIDTRFGKKRDRWVDGSVADLLGVPREQLTPLASRFSMLQNLTRSLMSVVSDYGFKNSCDFAVGNPSDKKLKYRPTKILETVRVSGRTVKFHTLLLLPARSANRQHLCIYWLEENKQSRLITCFPIMQLAIDELLGQNSGANVPIRPRFNAFVEQWPDTETPDKNTSDKNTLCGSRQIAILK